MRLQEILLLMILCKTKEKKRALLQERKSRYGHVCLVDQIEVSSDLSKSALSKIAARRWYFIAPPRLQQREAQQTPTSETHVIVIDPQVSEAFVNRRVLSRGHFD